MSKAWSTLIGNSIKADKDLKMALTEEQKRLNRIDRALQTYKCLTIGKVFNKYKVGVASLNQELVRLANADDEGFCVCITCGVRQQWNEMHGGHYVKRSNKATTLDPRNVWPQCVSCNSFDDGRAGPYRAALVAKFGEESVVDLEQTKLPKNHSWNRYELAEIKINLLDEIKKHKKRLGIK